jgi:K+-transporting ATPase ATPase C chain
MFAQLRAALVSLALLTAVTGVAYPLLVTGVAQAAFPSQANGSLIARDGQPVG